MKPFLRWLPVLVTGLLLAGCTAHGAVVASGAGFWQGLWHGAIFPVTFIVSLFNKDVGVYEAVNSGGWYNFGFFLGIAVSMGGGAGASAAGRRKRDR